MRANAPAEPTRGGRAVRAVLRGRRAGAPLDPAEPRLFLDRSPSQPPPFRCSGTDVWRLEIGGAATQIRKPWSDASSNAHSACRSNQARRIVAGRAGRAGGGRCQGHEPAGRRPAAHAAVRQPAGRAVGRPGLRACHALRRDQRGRGTPADRDLARRRAGGEQRSPSRTVARRAPPTTHAARCPMSRTARRRRAIAPADPDDDGGRRTEKANTRAMPGLPSSSA